MTVSIVIPCFNAARYVGEAVASACAQSWPGVEVVVVDDGSNDGSGAIAARSGKVRVLRQPNTGLARARNAGFAATRGDIVIFLDADDRLLPTAARQAVDTLDRQPDAALSVGRCLLVAADGSPLPTRHDEVHGDFYAELLRRNYIWMPAMAAFRRAAFEASGGFDPSVNASADYDLYLRLARAHSIAVHEGMVAEYRQHPHSMSGDPVLMLRTTLAVLRRQRAVVNGDRRLESRLCEGEHRWRWFYGERLVERFRLAIRQRQYVRALFDAAALLRFYPQGVRRHLQKKAALLRGASTQPGA